MFHCVSFALHATAHAADYLSLSMSELLSWPGTLREAESKLFTIELTIQPGGALGGNAANGFAESTVILRAISRPGAAPDSALVNLAWGNDLLASGITAAAFLEAFWRGTAAGHADALDFGRLLRRRLLSGRLQERWIEFSQWRGESPLRLELVLPRAAASPIGAIPFELLASEADEQSGSSFWFYGGLSVLVRRVRDFSPRPVELHRRARLLVAWANPPGVGAVADSTFVQHADLLVSAASGAGFQVAPTIAHATWSKLRTALEKTTWQVVSLMVHGSTGGGLVHLEAERRTSPAGLPVGENHRASELVPASSLAAALQRAGAQLALLWSCHAARHHEDLGSLAESLLSAHEGNLAAVLAAHGALRADWTPEAAGRLFTALTGPDGTDLEQAICRVRQTLHEHDLQWATLAYHARPHESRSVTVEQGAAQVVERLLSAPRTSRIPGLPARPRYWIDRPVEVKAVMERIQAQQLVTVQGMPGIGKTELAREAAELLVNTGPLAGVAVLWLALDQVGSVSALRGRFADWAGLKVTEVDDSRLAAFLVDRMALWILDNAEDLVRAEGPALRALFDAVLGQCPGVRILLTSQRPLGDLRSEREERYVVRRLEDPQVCERLFVAASASELDARAEPAALTALVQLLDGHPRSLVLVASQVRDGGANLGALHARLLKKGDEAVLSAELLGSDIDWSADDRLRTERLVSSLNLAYEPLLKSSPEAAELFTWLGTLPGGLPVAMAPAIFGVDAADHVAMLRRLSLVEIVGSDERLGLPAPVRWYAARRLDAEVLAVRQRELLIRTFEAISALMVAGYELRVKPGGGAVIAASRLEQQNLTALLERVEKGLLTVVLSDSAIRAFAMWSDVRRFGGQNQPQLLLMERARACLQESASRGWAYARFLLALGDVYFRNDRLVDAEGSFTVALDLFVALNDVVGQANTLQSLGDLHLYTDRLADAERSLGAALELFADESVGRANTLQSFADLSLRAGRLADAERFLRASLELCVSFDDALGHANTLLSLGQLYRRTGRFSEAKRSIGSALDLFVSLEDGLGRANSLLSLGELHLLCEDFVEAEHALDAALDLYDRFDHILGRAHTRSAFGQLALAKSKLPEAYDALRVARDQLLSIGERLGAASQLIYMSRVATAARLPERAIVLSGLAWRELGSIGDRLSQMVAVRNLVQVSDGVLQVQRRAALLVWDLAREVDPKLAAIVEASSPLLIFNSGLTDQERQSLEQSMLAAIDEIHQRMLAAGEDPLGPLPHPLSNSTAPAEEP